MADAPFAFLSLGAIIQAIRVRGTNIVLGFPSQADYVEHNAPYFGETIGRVANRIRGARIDSLNGRAYALTANNGPNTLHGGAHGWGKRIWDGPVPEGVRPIPGLDGLRGGETVAFSLLSPDGDQGFPGSVEARVAYTAATQDVGGREATVLGIEFEARLVAADVQETVVNMTNHSYFNLSGDATIDGTAVSLVTTNCLPVSDDGIPTGGPVPHPAIDAARPLTLTASGPDVDSCFVVAADPTSVPVDTRAQPLVRLLSAHHPETGIHLEVLSTEPAFQFYTGHFTDVPAVDGAPARGPRSGFCCEPGRFVNACNVPEWKAMTVLKQGETYGARIVYRMWVDS